METHRKLTERLDGAVVTTYQFRGLAFESEVQGGTRRYELEGEREVGRPVNRYLRFAAVLLATSGLFGFLLQHKLSDLSRKMNRG